MIWLSTFQAITFATKKLPTQNASAKLVTFPLQKFFVSNKKKSNAMTQLDLAMKVVEELTDGLIILFTIQGCIVCYAQFKSVFLIMT